MDEDRLYRLIGAYVRAKRREKGKSQSDLAAAAGMLRTSIANVEAGRQRLPLHTLYAVCADLGVSVAEMLRAIEEDLFWQPPEMDAFRSDDV